MKLFRLSLFFILIVTCFGYTSCGSDDDSTDLPTGKIELNKTSAELKVGETLSLIPEFSHDFVKEKGVEWSSNNPDIIKIDEKSDKSITITALAKGSVIVKIETLDQAISTTCKIEVIARNNNNEEGKVVRILAIGNSFTDDAVQDYLWQLATAADKKLVVARLTKEK